MIVSSCLAHRGSASLRARWSESDLPFIRELESALTYICLCASKQLGNLRLRCGLDQIRLHQERQDKGALRHFERLLGKAATAEHPTSNFVHCLGHQFNSVCGRLEFIQ